jgi:hypothetical protein
MPQRSAELHETAYGLLVLIAGLTLASAGCNTSDTDTQKQIPTSIPQSAQMPQPTPEELEQDQKAQQKSEAKPDKALMQPDGRKGHLQAGDSVLRVAPFGVWTKGIQFA